MGEDIMSCGLDLKTVVLCEVLELKAEAIAALGAYQRIKVLEEAKRNVKKWPNLNDAQRVEMNCALVRLRTAGSWQKRNGDLYDLPLEKRAESFANLRFERTSHGSRESHTPAGYDLAAKTHSEWGSATEEVLSSPLSPIDELMEHHPYAADGQSLRGLDDDGDSDSDTDKPSGIIVCYDDNFAESSTSSEDSIPGVYDEQSWRGLTKVRAESVQGSVGNAPTGMHGSELLAPDFNDVVQSFSRSDGEVVYFPAPVTQSYELQDCKVMVHGEDINEMIAEVMEEIDVESDGSMLAPWEMTFDFEEDERISFHSAQQVL